MADTLRVRLAERAAKRQAKGDKKAATGLPRAGSVPVGDEETDKGSGSHQLRPNDPGAWARVRRREFERIPEHLNGGEVVLAMTGGSTGGNRGLLVATDSRALFLSEGVVRHSFEEFPYDKMTNVTTTRGPLFAKIVFQTAGATRFVDVMSESEAETVAAIIRERIGSPPAAQTPPLT